MAQRPVIVRFYGAATKNEIRVLRVPWQAKLALREHNMSYTVYILEDQEDRTWYIGFTEDLKRRPKEHFEKRSPYTSKKGSMKLIYAEWYINKFDALGREKFLKSGAGHRFIKKQLRHYFTE